MNEEIMSLIEMEDKFQRYLQGTDYTFIGPVDQNLLEPFFKNINRIAPVKNVFNHSIHDALSQKNAVRSALDAIRPDVPLRIYVVSTSSSDMLLYNDMKGYCERNNIDYKMD